MNLPSQNYANQINLILKKIFKEENTKILKSAKLISKSYKISNNFN